MKSNRGFISVEIESHFGQHCIGQELSLSEKLARRLSSNCKHLSI